MIVNRGKRQLPGHSPGRLGEDLVVDARKIRGRWTRWIPVGLQHDVCTQKGRSGRLQRSTHSLRTCRPSSKRPSLRFVSPSATPPTRSSSTGHGEILEQLLVSSPPAHPLLCGSSLGKPRLVPIPRSNCDSVQVTVNNIASDVLPPGRTGGVRLGCLCQVGIF